jgi:hypothetical protein
MTQHRCACGYEADSPEDLTVHLGEMFTPPDDIAPDGQVHTEAASDASDTSTAGALTCRCGFTAGDIGDFDAHLLAAFTPDDHTGLDGVRHAPA